MKSPTSVFARSTALLFGAVGLLALAACMERDPADPGLTGPAFTSQSVEVISGTGTAHVDGYLGAAEWDGAGTHTFDAYVPGRDGQKQTSVTLRVMNDNETLYLAVEYDRPISNPNNVVRILFHLNGACDEFTMSSGDPQDRYRTDCAEASTSVLDQLHHGTGVRNNSGGRTVYELSKPLCSEDGQDLCAASSYAKFSFTLELVPGGNAQSSRISGSVQIGTAPPADDPNLPNVTVDVICDERGDRCDNTVIARSTDGSDLRVQCAVDQKDGTGKATFVDLWLDTKYVYSLRNMLICAASHLRVWPNFEPVETDDLPQRQSVVFVPNPTSGDYSAGTPKPLIPLNLYEAYKNAKPIPNGEHQITLAFLYEGTRRVSVDVPGSSSHVFVFGTSGLLDEGPNGVGKQNDKLAPYPAAIGWYVAYVAKTSSPAILVLPADEPGLMEGEDRDKNRYIGYAEPGATNVTLYQMPGFYYTYYIDEPFGDAPLRKDDLGPVVYGTGNIEVGEAVEQTDDFYIQTLIRAVQESGTFQLVFYADKLNGSTDSRQAKVLLNKQEGTCKLAEDVPSVAVECGLDPDGDGWVRVRFDFTGIDSAQVRVRGGVADAFDWAPDVGYAPWVRTGIPGQSLRVF
jgi:hypothetical protein